MNRDDIIRMAREAGFHILQGSKGLMYALSIDHMQKFAKLVVEAEREACAKVAETPVVGEQDDITMEAKDRVAAAIRARGQE